MTTPNPQRGSVYAGQGTWDNGEVMDPARATTTDTGPDEQLARAQREQARLLAEDYQRELDRRPPVPREEKFPLPAEVAELEPGKRYRVSFTDCCVDGWFDAVFQGVEWTPNAKGDPPNYPSGLIFHTAWIDAHGSWTAELVEGASG